MGASNEWFEHHLPPSGWIEGSKKIDFGGLKEELTPENRVLSIRGTEELPSPFSDLNCEVEVIWIQPETDEVKKLIKKFSKLPPETSRWGDYKI